VHQGDGDGPGWSADISSGHLEQAGLVHCHRRVSIHVHGLDIHTYIGVVQKVLYAEVRGGRGARGCIRRDV